MLATSFTTHATFSLLFSSRCRSSVVLPAPRKPLSMVIGVLLCWMTSASFLGAEPSMLGALRACGLACGTSHSSAGTIRK